MIPPSRSLWLTAVALVAFAANSILCRLALASESLDPVSFTTVRLASGAVILTALARLRARRDAVSEPPWPGAVTLFLYALCFSLAYVSLEAGTGALLLFGGVQVTMLVAGLARGERLGAGEWGGLVVAIGGLVWLLAPGVSAPSPRGALLMLAAGVSWGVYSLLGRRAGDPLRRTATSFSRSLPLAAAASLAALATAELSPYGLALAVLSGAVTSGLGYVVWYAALAGHSAASAAIVQLAVPVLAALAGVFVLGESVTMRLLGASVATLGGVALAVVSRSRAGYRS